MERPTRIPAQIPEGRPAGSTLDSQTGRAVGAFISAALQEYTAEKPLDPERTSYFLLDILPMLVGNMYPLSLAPLATPSLRGAFPMLRKVSRAYDLVAYKRFSESYQAVIRDAMEDEKQGVKDYPTEFTPEDGYHPDRIELTPGETQILRLFTNAAGVFYDGKQTIFPFSMVEQRQVSESHIVESSPSSTAKETVQ